MIDEEKRGALFYDIHKAIEESAESVVSQLQDLSLSYPPGVELSKDEEEALSGLRLSQQAKSGLKKIVTDACAYPLFHFFSLLDGVTGPEIDSNDEWFGATIAEKPEEDEPMLHDELYESYWTYHKKEKTI